MPAETATDVEKTLRGLAKRLHPGSRTKATVTIRGTAARFGAIAADAEILLRRGGIDERQLRRIRYVLDESETETSPARLAAAVRRVMQRQQ